MSQGSSVILRDPISGKGVSVDTNGRLETTAQIGFSGDIQLGAVELKDATQDVRVNVEALGGKNAQYIRGIELAQISGDSADIKTATEAIQTAVEILDDVVGTIDSAFSGKVIVMGGKAESTVPTEVADADAVAKWLDTFGRQILYGANLGIGALDVNEVAPALQQIMEVTLLDAVTATGDSAVVDVSNYNKLTFHEIASGVSTGAALVLRHSLDNTNFVVVDSGDIVANGVTEVTVSDKKYKYVKANVASRSDGTYSVKMIAGN